MTRSRLLRIGCVLAGLLAGGPGAAGAGGLTFRELHRETLLFDAEGATSVAVSPDNAHVYLAWRDIDQVCVWSRNPATNELTFVDCAWDGLDGVDLMRSPSAVTVSPDGLCVYVTSEQENSVVVFSRNAATGELTFIQSLKDGAGGVDGLNDALDVVASPDDAHVYVVGETDNAVVVFKRTGCGLNFVERQKHHVGGVVMFHPQALTISADGANVYVGAMNGVRGAMVTFGRDSGTGKLTFLESRIASDLRPRIGGVAISPNGANVYATSRTLDTVVTFTRDAGTGLLTELQSLRRGGALKGIAGAAGVTVSPDGGYVYVAGPFDDAVVVFSRDTGTGALRFLELHDERIAGTRVLEGAKDLAVTPDGTGLYVAAFDAGALVVFDVDTCGNGGVGIDEHCDDGNTMGGDACSATCRLDLCPTAPMSGCRTTIDPKDAALVIKNQSDDAKDALSFGWKGQATSFPEFGNPRTTTSYAICVYDGSAAPQPIMSRVAPADGLCDGKPCWKATSTVYTYGDNTLTPDGLHRVVLRRGLQDGDTRVDVDGKGNVLAPPVLPLTLPVVVQVQNSDGTVCWSATYSTAIKNQSDQFNAKSD